MSVLDNKGVDEILLEMGKISITDFKKALEYKRKTNKNIEDILIEFGLVTQEDIMSAVAAKNGTSYVDLDNYGNIDRALVAKIPQNFLVRYNLIPLELHNGELTVAMSDTEDIYLIDDLRLETGFDIKPILADEEKIRHKIDIYLNRKPQPQPTRPSALEQSMLDTNTRRPANGNVERPASIRNPRGPAPNSGIPVSFNEKVSQQGTQNNPENIQNQQNRPVSSSNKDMREANTGGRAESFKGKEMNFDVNSGNPTNSRHATGNKPVQTFNKDEFEDLFGNLYSEIQEEDLDLGNSQDDNEFDFRKNFDINKKEIPNTKSEKKFNMDNKISSDNNKSTTINRNSKTSNGYKDEESEFGEMFNKFSAGLENDDDDDFESFLNSSNFDGTDNENSFNSYSEDSDENEKYDDYNNETYSDNDNYSNNDTYSDNDNYSNNDTDGNNDNNYYDFNDNRLNDTNFNDNEVSNNEDNNYSENFNRKDLNRNHYNNEEDGADYFKTKANTINKDSQIFTDNNSQSDSYESKVGLFQDNYNGVEKRKKESNFYDNENNENADITTRTQDNNLLSNIFENANASASANASANANINYEIDVENKPLFKEKLGSHLLKNGAISEIQLKEALEIQKSSGDFLGVVLIKKGFIKRKTLYQFLEKQLGVRYIDLDSIEILPSVLSLVSENLAKTHNLIPFAREDMVLKVAMSDPLNIFSVDDLRMTTGMEIQTFLADDEQIKGIIDIYYDKMRDTGDVYKKMQEIELLDKEFKKVNEAVEFEINDEEEEDVEKANVEDAPIVKLVNVIFQGAVTRKASDIHIEPQEDMLLIRYRVDGELTDAMTQDKKVALSLIARIKIISGLNIAEKRIPQDGRITVNISKKPYDMRVSVLPTMFGEKIVIRIADKEGFNVTKQQLGFFDEDMKKFDNILEHPHGVVLVTGPTGSGKSTTLYTALKELSKPNVNITTVEDPVECTIKGINQTQVNVKAGLTFAVALRSFLRQDPDIIMLGEIRDTETAEIAIRAAITGHLVLSTLHTNDAPSTITRIIDMGIEPYLISSAIEGIIAQRLVRKLCKNCKKEHMPTMEEKELLGLTNKNNIVIFEAGSCDQCGGSGYKGRIAVHEVMTFNRELRDLVAKNVTSDVLKDAAVKNGMVTLRANCIRLINKGITSIEELSGISQIDD